MRRFQIAFAEGETSALGFGGDGPPDLVFLHATGFNAETYRPILERLGDRFRVLAIDQRGHGRCALAARPRSFGGWKDYVDDFLTLGDLLRGQAIPPVLAGHSMGATVALIAATRRPEIADRLVLLDPVTPPNQLAMLPHWLLPLRLRIERMPIARAAARRRDRFPSRADALASYCGRGAFATWEPGFLEAYVEGGFADTDHGDVALTCAPMWEATTFATHRANVVGALGRLTRPALLLRAAHGTAVRARRARLERLNPRLTIETPPGTSHFLPMEKPDLVYERLTQALVERARRVALPRAQGSGMPATLPLTADTVP